VASRGCSNGTRAGEAAGGCWFGAAEIEEGQSQGKKRKKTK